MGIKSIETKYMEERDALFRKLKNVSRRDFVKLAAISAGAAAAKGLLPPQSFQLVNVAHADEAKGATRAGGASAFSFAYISDTHLYKRELNDRFVRSILKAVDDVNALSPQPDFVELFNNLLTTQACVSVNGLGNNPIGFHQAKVVFGVGIIGIGSQS